MAAYNRKSTQELATLAAVNPPTFSGVEQSEEMLKWIWENFSAVAGDQPSFECWRISLFRFLSTPLQPFFRTLITQYHCSFSDLLPKPLSPF
jgi:hypothetical protein